MLREGREYAPVLVAFRPTVPSFQEREAIMPVSLLFTAHPDADVTEGQWATYLIAVSALLPPGSVAITSRPSAWWRVVMASENEASPLLAALAVVERDMGMVGTMEYGTTSALGPLPPAPPKPVVRRWLGADCNMADLATTLKSFPTLRYMRDFGTPNDWSPTSGRAAIVASAQTVVHYSQKGTDPGKLDHALSTLMYPSMWTYYHEPMGNVAPATYVRNAASLCAQIKAHAQRDLITHNGPILTRFWQAQKGNVAEQWMYPGANAFFSDCYIGSYKATSAASYPSPGWMFDVVAATASKLKLPWGVPELGGARHEVFDPTGVKRAQWIRDMWTYLKADSNFIAAGWWNIGGCFIMPGSPEEGALRGVLTEAAGLPSVRKPGR